MITIERNGWSVSRRLGVGDREHVRSGLLQVYCMVPKDVITQVAGSLAAAQKLVKTLRVYVNAAKLPPDIMRHLIMVTMGRARDHDIMEETDLSRKHFDWIVGRCDIIVQPLGGTQDDLRDLIIEVWNSTGGREILKGNPGRIPESELKLRYPQFFGGEDELWEQIK